MCYKRRLNKIQKEIKEIEETLLEGYEEIMKARTMMTKADKGRLALMRRLVQLRKELEDGQRKIPG